MAGQRALQSFVARIWLEREQNGEPVWRGHIRHVQGTREAHFQDLGKMREFLQHVTGVAGPKMTAQPLKDATESESGTVTKLPGSGSRT